MLLVAMYRCQSVSLRTVKKVLVSFGVVYEHHGAMVPGLANRNGHRNFAAGRNKSGWGGVRVKNLLVAEVDRWLHDDAVSAKSSRTHDLVVQIAEESIDSSDEEFSNGE